MAKAQWHIFGLSLQLSLTDWRQCGTLILILSHLSVSRRTTFFNTFCSIISASTVIGRGESEKESQITTENDENDKMSPTKGATILE